MAPASVGFVVAVELQQEAPGQEIHLGFDVIVAGGGVDLVIHGQCSIGAATVRIRIGNLDLHGGGVGLSICLQGGLIGSQRFGVIGKFAEGVAALLLHVGIQQAGAQLQVACVGIRRFL